MAQEKLTLEEILANPDERIKLIVELIDDFVKSKAKRKNILKRRLFWRFFLYSL